MTTAAAPSLGSLPEVMGLFKSLLQAILDLAPAERVVILFGERRDRDLTPRVGHGLKLKNFWVAAPISLSILRRVRQDGQPVLGGVEGTEEDESLSLMLSAARSMMCLPFWGPSGEVCGLLYADTTSESRPFTRQHLSETLQLLRRVEEQLNVIRDGGIPSGLRPAQPTARPRPWPVAPRIPVSAPPITRLPVPSRRAQALFFRSLATLFEAGVPLPRTLAVLTAQAEEPRMGRMAEELHQHVLKGRSLSQAMDLTGAFTNFQLRMIAVAEQTGKFHCVLPRLADYQEACRRAELRLKSALAYPSLVMLACLTALVVLPGYLMAGQFQLLRELKVPLPALTRALSLFSELTRSPQAWVLAGLGVALGGLALTRARRRPELRRLLYRRLRRLPLLGRVLTHQALAQFSMVLAHQMEAGVLLADAIPLACRTVNDPLLEQVGPRVVAGVFEGLSLATSLEAVRAFPRSFCELVRVGEETGQLAPVLLWMARNHEQEVELGLAALAALLEPLVMMVMGLLAALIMIATMLPMIRALESL